MSDEIPFLEKCKNYIIVRWPHLFEAIQKNNFVEPLGSDYQLKELIIDCLKSKTKSYHYVLPTQLLCKSVNSSLDCHSLQAAYNTEGAFDARTIAHGVIVPFDRENHNVLGGSPEPYVNNPLRCPAVTREYRSQQKNKKDWDKLIKILDIVEERNDEKFTAKVFDQLLVEIYKLLSESKVIYPTPNRISLDQTISLIWHFIEGKSGGDRIEAICAAFFKTIAEEFDLFDEVRRGKINEADASSGMVADIECWLKGKIILLVEVKDRSLTLTQLNSKLDIARSKTISEILFIAEQGLDKAEEKEVKKRIESEFSSGQNIYISNFLDFSTGILILLAEKGRVLFLSKVGEELEITNSAIVNRKAWANLLKSF